ncbi:energy transducer TonB [Sphingomonas endophytica]|uniref:TonB C-terminal domain-containing protein n=1 Tax=Sphingomonas endophytica TaxID=869719 RepID=A0A147HVQ7_9SPHN|nr:energy transducer TonB [Sphingomonas endophytica]KTT68945.1 hypothetical protein NS334_15645 [Sphingomonas endophytica]
MAYADQMGGSRRLTTIAGVAAIHGLIGYVFISGMAAHFVRTVTDPFTVTNIPLETPPPPDAPPPVAKAAPQQPTAAPPITAVTPIVPTQNNPVVVTVVPLPPLPMGTGEAVTVTVTPPPPPLMPSKASGVRARGDRTQWITTEDYPASALRAGEQGVVGIALRVGSDGRAESCAVTTSSGHPSLDQATCRLYMRRAKFTPARDDSGAEVAATFNDRVRWQLPM